MVQPSSVFTLLTIGHVKLHTANNLHMHGGAGCLCVLLCVLHPCKYVFTIPKLNVPMRERKVSLLFHRKTKTNQQIQFLSKKVFDRQFIHGGIPAFGHKRKTYAIFGSVSVREQFSGAVCFLRVSLLVVLRLFLWY